MSNAAHATVCATEFTVPTDSGALTLEAGTTAVSDKETIESQTRIIERLTETIFTLTAQLSGKNRATETEQTSKRVNGKHLMYRGSDFWSHGYCVDPTHNSGTCTKRENGHKVEATHDKPLGGCACGKPKNM